MADIPNETKTESINSIQSAINKSEKAFMQLSRKGLNTLLIERRLQALRIALAVLNSNWNGISFYYTWEDLTEARNILASLLPSMKDICARSKIGSPQGTLLARRIRALELAVQAIEQIANEFPTIMQCILPSSQKTEL